MKHTILVVDDSTTTLDTLHEVLTREGYGVILCERGEDAIEKISENEVSVVLTDFMLPGIDGLEVLDYVTGKFSHVPVILITGHGSVDNAVEAMKKGAYDYLTKPIDLGRLRALVEKGITLHNIQMENISLHKKLSEQKAFSEIIGTSPAIRGVLETVKQVAPTNTPVLITGESGTGKEMVANALHATSSRADGPFIKINSSAMPRELLESELFGHEKGAFTGAFKTKKGRFELADDGTLFLDEIGDMPPELQVKLLRVLQDGEFERLGGIQTLKADVRLITATNTNLEAAMAKGKFREDLYYRVKVVHIKIPSLRERAEDIPLLVSHYLKILRRRHGGKKTVSEEAFAALVDYSWPGNIRELFNALEQAYVMSASDRIDGKNLPEEVVLNKKKHRSRDEAPAPPGEASESLKLVDAEKAFMRKALAQAGGNKAKAAKALGISLSTLLRKMKKYGLSDKPG